MTEIRLKAAPTWWGRPLIAAAFGAVHIAIAVERATGRRIGIGHNGVLWRLLTFAVIYGFRVTVV